MYPSRFYQNKLTVWVRSPTTVFTFAHLFVLAVQRLVALLYSNHDVLPFSLPRLLILCLLQLDTIHPFRYCSDAIILFPLS